mmetsp:Transcript_14072/g.27061  ORF Transcript_14072/g.27061 Transcript_14072/m.27061 type:complete len:90 (-) Transcript_14072:1139-1408(-)
MTSCAASDTAPSWAIACDARPIVYIVTMLFEDKAKPADSTGMLSWRLGGGKMSFGAHFFVFSREYRSKLHDRMVEMVEDAAAPPTPQPN